MILVQAASPCDLATATAVLFARRRGQLFPATQIAIDLDLLGDGRTTTTSLFGKVFFLLLSGSRGTSTSRRAFLLLFRVDHLATAAAS